LSRTFKVPKTDCVKCLRATHTRKPLLPVYDRKGAENRLAIRLWRNYIEIGELSTKNWWFARLFVLVQKDVLPGWKTLVAVKPKPSD
jgi:hypothetical protein